MKRIIASGIIENVREIRPCSWCGNSLRVGDKAVWLNGLCYCSFDCINESDAELAQIKGK